MNCSLKDYFANLKRFEPLFLTVWMDGLFKAKVVLLAAMFPQRTINISTWSHDINVHGGTF